MDDLNSPQNTKNSFALLSRRELSQAIRSFSKKKTVVFIGFLAIFLLSTLGILQSVNRYFMVSVPIQGGAVTEGIIGTPRFVNPLLAFSDADRDMTTLIYSGLMRKNADGSLAPDLAEKYEISPDGLTYTFTLRENIFFHDGRPVTADDIIFTIKQVQDPVIKSPRRVNWTGVEVEKIDDRTISFRLREQFSSFLENSTLGIIPAHVWNTASPFELNEANTRPVGSGPYKIKKVGKEESGTITLYELEAFNKFALGKPYIKSFIFHFYQNETELLEALNRGEISQLGSITPGNAEVLKERGYRVEFSTLPRVFGLFFNQNENQLFIDKAVVQAIDRAINRERIVNDVLVGFGVVINNPIPSNVWDYKHPNKENSFSQEEKLVQVRASLEKAGWKLGEGGYLEKTITENGKKATKTLEFSIATGNAPELAKSASLIQENLKEVGMKVNVKTFDSGNLNQSVIRPRKYEALLFGQIIQSKTDLYAFWHSSQRLDPGLNIALYTNTRVDKILESIFTTTNPEELAKKYAEFESEIEKDMPAVFLYSPSFIYIVDPKVQGVSFDRIASPSGRFANAYLWYINTDNIWRIFSK